MNGRIRLKAVLLGDPGVSKTTMIHEFLKTGRSNAPNDLKIFHFSTCELEFSFNKKNCFGNTENPVLISVWDTCERRTRSSPRSSSKAGPSSSRSRRGSSMSNASCSSRLQIRTLSLIVLGDFSVGKTTTCLKFGEHKQRLSHQAFPLSVSSEIEVRDTKVNVRVKDTGGQEKYRSLTASYYRGAHGCLILYDVTKESSFDNLNHWLHDLKEYTSQPEISTIIVGTKCHVPEDKREVTYERAQKFAESVNLPYMEVSAEEGINITEVFEKLADLIIESLNKDTMLGPIQPNGPHVILDSKTTKKKQQWCSC